MVIKVRQGHCLVIGLVHVLKILTLSCFFLGLFNVFSASKSEKNDVKLSLTHQ
jgi:hypothetical protein